MCIQVLDRFTGIFGLCVYFFWGRGPEGLLTTRGLAWALPGVAMHVCRLGSTCSNVVVECSSLYGPLLGLGLVMGVIDDINIKIYHRRDQRPFRPNTSQLQISSVVYVMEETYLSDNVQLYELSAKISRGVRLN